MARSAWRWLLAVGAAACAGGAPQLRASEPPAQLQVRRVAEILARHHPSHAPLDAATAARAHARLLHALDPATDCTAARAGLQADAAQVAAALRQGDFSFVVRAARTCAGRELTGGEAQTLALDALAGAYDPFSHYLDPAALDRRRAGTHAGATQLARGRMLERAGMRVAWIELPSFYLRPRHSASADVASIARQLHARGAQLLVLDLRGNGGGVVAEALALASALLGGGALAHERDAAGRVRVLHGPIRERAWHGPLVLIIDRGTASMAELFAAALQDRARALLVGERSYGKGLAQTLVLLGSPLGTSQGAVEVSERAFYRLDGSVLQGRGVVPDVALS
ncbi:MAG TPA: S41 family peptidase, partial [Polyangiales bacterium]|nr:S41 family peptidase [Polyangiales bacterium]